MSKYIEPLGKFISKMPKDEGLYNLSAGWDMFCYFEYYPISVQCSHFISPENTRKLFLT